MGDISSKSLLSKGVIILFLLNMFFLIYLILIKTNLLGSDSTAYIQGANSLLEYNVFSSMGEIDIPDNFRTIGYPAIIALGMLISSEYYINVVIAMQVVLLYLMFVKFVNIGNILNVNLYPVVLVPFIFHQELLILATSLQTEFLYIFTLFLFFLFTIKYFKTRNVKDLILSAVFIAFSLHIKPVYLFFVIVYLAIIFLFDKKIKNVIIVLLIMSVIIAPWIVRNKITLDTYSFTSSKNFNLLCYAYTLTKAKYNLTDDEASKKVDDMIIEKYNLKKNSSMLDFVSSQDNELIDNIIPIEAKKIIFGNIEYMPEIYIKGVLRGFYLPHTIYNVEKNSPVHISNFIEKVKQKDIKSIFITDDSINHSVMYFYVLPYILNLIVIISLFVFSFLWLARKQFRTYQTTFILLFVLYGLAIAFPTTNNSRYMMAYFPQMTVMFLYILNYLIIVRRGENECFR